MKQTITRRSVVAGAASLVVLGGSRPARAQAKIKLRFSCAFTEADLRAQAYKEFAAAIKDDFDFEPYWGNTLFKQGTELVALQRDNLDLCNLAPADISKQIPAWSLMTAAFLFRDADHMKKTFKSDVGKDFIKMAKDQLGIQIITPVYFGSRSVNLKPDKQIKTLPTWQASSSACRRVNSGNSSANRSAPIPRRSPMRSFTQRCKPARSTARTIRSWRAS